MQAVKTIGLDIAKSGFQVHGVDADGQVVFRRQLKRRNVLAFFQKVPSCLVGMEACATSHHWSRELQALGHSVRLMPPAYVKPYVKRQKNDSHDSDFDTAFVGLTAQEANALLVASDPYFSSRRGRIIRLRPAMASPLFINDATFPTPEA